MTASSLVQPRVLIPFLVATAIWGSTWIVIRDQLGVVPPTWSIAYRFAAASAAMFIWGLVRGESMRLSPRDQGFVALFGIAQFALNFNGVYRAEDHVTSGLVAVVFALMIVPNAVLGRIFLKQPLSARFLAGSAVAVVGVAMLIVQEARRDGSSATETALGIGLTLAGMMCASASNVVMGTARAKALPMTAMLAWGMLWGALSNAGIALVTAGPPVMDWRPGYIFGFLYLGILASAVAFACYFAVIRAVGPARAAYSGVITPLLAMLISTLVEHYRWTPLAIAGGVVAMAGLLIALSAPRPATKSG